MKITKKDLHDWIMNDTPVRFNNEIYKACFNGKEYFLYNHVNNKNIAIYKKARGVYGLVTNKQ